MKIVNSVNHDVEIGSVVDILNRYFKNNTHSKVVVIGDENTLHHCWSKIVGKVDALLNAELIELESGEENKTLEICANVWLTLTELKLSRKDLVINLGGGVVTDLGGFVANTFKRGVNFIQIPTTVLSMVDAAVGGKVGVDFQGLKNLIGNFATPNLVVVDTAFINTVSEEQLKSGFAEILKHGLIIDRSYWKLSKSVGNVSAQNLIPLIERSIEIKNEIVLNDFKESGERKKLNFGHTIGHAVETYMLNMGSPILHGHAVAIGMIAESFISMKKGYLNELNFSEIDDYLRATYAMPEFDEAKFEELIELMKNDKKNSGSSKISMTLLDGIGESHIEESVEQEHISASLAYLFAK